MKQSHTVKLRISGHAHILFLVCLSGVFIEPFEANGSLLYFHQKTRGMQGISKWETDFKSTDKDAIS